MKVMSDHGWTRTGISLLWGAETLAGLASPAEICSIRQFFEFSSNWPDDLPSGGGRTIIVAGVEGCLDSLDPDEAESWLEEDLKPKILGFQEEYVRQAGLVLWLPGGRKRVEMARANESYHWHCAPPNKDRILDIGRMLWAGAEPDAVRILDSSAANLDADGPAWVGLFHPRIS